MKERIIKKLTSRKFWIAICTEIAVLLHLFHIPDGTINQIVAIITATATCIAYIIAEGLTDAKGVENEHKDS